VNELELVQSRISFDGILSEILLKFNLGGQVAGCRQLGVDVGPFGRYAAGILCASAEIAEKANSAATKLANETTIWYPRVRGFGIHYSEAEIVQVIKCCLQF
jgi:hypothetical protein